MTTRTALPSKWIVRFPTPESLRRLDEVERILRESNTEYRRETPFDIEAFDIHPRVWSECDATWSGW